MQAGSERGAATAPRSAWEGKTVKNARWTRLLVLLRLLRPANLAQFSGYLRKYGLRLCFARTIFILSLALGLRQSEESPTRKPLAHKAGRREEPLKRKVPDAPPPLDGCQDALRLELTTIKDGLTDSLRRTRTTNG